MRVFLVVMDDSDESLSALRYAARSAAASNGSVHILAVTEQNVSAFGTVQATLEQEARDRVEMLANGAAGNLFEESGIMPAISLKTGAGPKVITEFLQEHDEIAALVLGAAQSGGPGPLVSYFTSNMNNMPCPVYVVPPNYEPSHSAN